jgi:hypothetical protein
MSCCTLENARHIDILHGMKYRYACLALAVAACGKAQEDQLPPGPDTAVVAAPYTGLKACELISANEINRIAGLSVDTGFVTSDYSADSQCQFDKKGTTDGQVIVTMHGHGNIEPYRKVPGSTEVTGIGDAAVWNEGNAQLAVRHRESVFSVSFLSRPAKKRWVIALARIALENMSESH